MIHTIGNSPIPIEPGTSLALVLRSPLFDNSDGKTPGSFIFNHKLPATPALREVFGQGHRTTRAGRATSELPYVFQEGTLRYTGTCLLQEANELEYEVLYNVRNGDFAYEAANVSLKDLDLGGDREIAKTNSSAHNYNPIYRLQYNAGYFFHVMDLVFYSVDLDLTGSFNAEGTLFTCASDETLLITVLFKLNTIYGVHFYLDLYKGPSVVTSVTITSADTSKTIEMPVIAGQVLKVGIRVEGQNIGSQYAVEYDLRDISLEIRSKDDSWSENSEYAVFPIQNTNLFDNFPKDEFQIDNVNIQKVYNEYFFVQNYYKDGHFPFLLSGVIADEFISARNIFTPFVFIQYLLTVIGNRFNYEIINAPFGIASDYYNAVLFNSFAENTYTNDITRMIAVKPSFNLTDHVPDININTFLNSLGKILGYRIDIDTEHRTLTFINLKSVIESTDSIPFPGIITESPTVIVAPQYNGYKLEFKAASDKFISEQIKQVNSKHIYKGSKATRDLLPSSGNNVNDLYLVIQTNSFYVWKYSPVIYALDWVFHSQNFYLTKQSGVEPFLEISSVMAPVIDNLVPDNTLGAPANRSWRIPVTSQAGNFEGFPDMSAEYGLQILCYRGLWPDTNNEMYPMAVSSQNNTSGYMPFTHPNMCLDGPTPNIFTEALQTWLEWIVYNTKPVKLKAILTPAQLKQIHFAKKYRILGNNYLIEEIRTNMIDDHLSEAEIKAYTC